LRGRAKYLAAGEESLASERARIVSGVLEAGEEESCISEGEEISGALEAGEEGILHLRGRGEYLISWKLKKRHLASQRASKVSGTLKAGEGCISELERGGESLLAKRYSAQKEKMPEKTNCQGNSIFGLRVECLI
jgi:hypothetical protein